MKVHLLFYLIGAGFALAGLILGFIGVGPRAYGWYGVSWAFTLVTLSMVILDVIWLRPNALAKETKEA